MASGIATLQVTNLSILGWQTIGNGVALLIIQNGGSVQVNACRTAATSLKLTPTIRLRLCRRTRGMLVTTDLRNAGIDLLADATGLIERSSRI